MDREQPQGESKSRRRLRYALLYFVVLVVSILFLSRAHGVRRSLLTTSEEADGFLGNGVWGLLLCAGLIINVLVLSRPVCSFIGCFYNSAVLEVEGMHVGGWMVC